MNIVNEMIGDCTKTQAVRSTQVVFWLDALKTSVNHALQTQEELRKRLNTIIKEDDKKEECEQAPKENLVELAAHLRAVKENVDKIVKSNQLMLANCEL